MKNWLLSYLHKVYSQGEISESSTDCSLSSIKLILTVILIGGNFWNNWAINSMVLHQKIFDMVSQALHTHNSSILSNHLNFQISFHGHFFIRHFDIAGLPKLESQLLHLNIFSWSLLEWFLNLHEFPILEAYISYSNHLNFLIYFLMDTFFLDVWYCRVSKTRITIVTSEQLFVIFMNTSNMILQFAWAFKSGSIHFIFKYIDLNFMDSYYMFFQII